MLKASKLAQALPNNHLPSDMPTQTTPHPTSTITQELPQSHILACSATADTQAASNNTSLSEDLQLTLTSESLLTLDASPARALSSDPSFSAQLQPELSPKTLSTGLVYRSLYPLRAHWKTLGTLLNIEYGTLEAIETNERTTENCLSALVAQWLDCNTPLATWQELYEAVNTINPNEAQRIRCMVEGSDVTRTERRSNQAGSV